MRYKAKIDWFVSVSILVGIAAPAFIAITQNLPWMSAASVFAAILVFGILIRSGMKQDPMRSSSGQGSPLA